MTSFSGVALTARMSFQNGNGEKMATHRRSRLMRVVHAHEGKWLKAPCPQSLVCRESRRALYGRFPKPDFRRLHLYP